MISKRVLPVVFALQLQCSASWGAYVVRISDLNYSPTPPNPIMVCGHVTSESPLKISDGRAEITVTGVTAQTGDYLTLEGNWDGSELSVTQDVGKVSVYAGGSLVEMVYIPAGSFLMGNNGHEPYSPSSEFPQHSVYLSGYWLGRYEVTRGEYRRFMDAGGYSNPAYWSAAGWSWKVNNGRTQPDWWATAQDWYDACDQCSYAFTQTESHPVVGVVYYEAEAYCKWAGGHLPTEAQWEKAARWDGHPRVYPWGDTWDYEKCNNFGDHNAAGGGYQRYQTAPVGSYPAGVSPYGCQDMAGNVFEWCQDWYGSSYYSQVPGGGWNDPQGPSSGSYRVLRGGGWSDFDYDDRCAGRGCSIPDYYWSSYGGFRLAR